MTRARLTKPQRAFLREQLGEAIEHTTRYTIRSACRHNLTSGHYGPWEAKYRALCGPGHRVFDRIAADASGATIRTWDGAE